FLIGTKALFNFEFDLAGDAFREAQKADPAFALGYWGEAMSFNHPLWAEQDLASARRALEKLAPTAGARAAKAPVGKERELVEAAALALEVFQRHPQHPGAAHFIIHAFDDPDHAILALPAARAYSRIAPSAAHALHMPSHIFVQLGMWDDVVASNIVAYKAAVDLADRKNLPRGREDFHTLSWLQYAYLQEGKLADAAKALDTAKAVADKDRTPG